MSLTFNRQVRLLLSIATICCLLDTTSCKISPELLTNLETTLAQLRANKALVEQSARDVQSTAVGARSLSVVNDNYEDLREYYNHYLETIIGNPAAAAVTTSTLAKQMRQAARLYFVHSGKVLGATDSDYRALEGTDILSIPSDLPRLLSQLPKKEREVLITTLTPEVELQPWRKLN